MKFLVDAQLPKRLVYFLQAEGHDVLHTRELPHGNRTTDSTINQISLLEKRIVITKDADFTNSYFLVGEPYKLLLVSTGNIKNDDLIRLFERNIDSIVEVFETNSLVELDQQHLVIHR